MERGTNDDLFEALRAWVAANYPGNIATHIVIRLSGCKDAVRLPVPVAMAGTIKTPGTAES